jgi:hypothetical protein
MGIFQNGGIPVFYRLSKRELFKMAEFPLSTGIENGNFSKWRNSRFLPALKTGIFQNGGIPIFLPALKMGIFQNGEIPVFYRH